MDFIRSHIISQTLGIWSSLCREFSNNSWFYFIHPVKDGDRKIDRIGKGLLYYEDEIVPASWNKVDGKALLEIFYLTRNRKLYFYREEGSQRFKLKLK
jgi:hypothetical protein